MKHFSIHYKTTSALIMTGVCLLHVLCTNLISEMHFSAPKKETTEITSTTLAEDLSPEPPEPLAVKNLLHISAVNPGYKLDKPDVGELIELHNLSDASLSLAGFSLRYTNGAGTTKTLVEFPDGSLMAGEYLLLTYKTSPEASRADLTYPLSLALTAGPLELLYEGEVIDTVCWTGDEPCKDPFKTAAPSTLVWNQDQADFTHEFTYEAHFNLGEERLILPEPPADEPNLPDSTEPEENSPHGICRGVEFTEIYTYYEKDSSEQYIELYNRSKETIDLQNCRLRYKNKNYQLSGIISPDEYFVYHSASNFSLTKNPSKSNTIELINFDNELVDELTYPKGQKKSASYSKFIDTDASEYWAITFHRTPAQANIYQEFQTCPAGKIINPETGNCIKATSSSLTTECPAGKYRNPLTGRCKTIETDTSEVKSCAEGYERNPLTNRCRKIKTENTGTDFALVPATSTTDNTKTVFIAAGIVIVLVLAGIVYIVLQFRHEIARTARKLGQRFNRFFKDLIARKIGRNRDKDA